MYLLFCYSYSTGGEPFCLPDCLMVVGIFASMFDAGLRWCLAMRTHVLADGQTDGRMDGKRNGQTDVRIICINYFLFTIFLVCWLFSSYILFFLSLCLDSIAARSLNVLIMTLVYFRLVVFFFLLFKSPFEFVMIVKCLFIGEN